MLCQIDLPKYPYLKLRKQGNKVTAEFIIQDRLGSGLILWGDHKIRKTPIEDTKFCTVVELSPIHYTSAFDCAYRIVTEDQGIFGLYRGFRLTVGSSEITSET